MQPCCAPAAALGLALFALLWSRTAGAEPAVHGADRPQPQRKPSSWHLSAEVATDLPVSVGGRVALQLPYRFRLSSSVGYVPGIYVDAINSIARSFDGYSDAVAELIESSLNSSFVWRTHVGFQPIPRRGFYVDAGYGFVRLSGNATAQQVIDVCNCIDTSNVQVDGRRYDATAVLAGRTYAIDSTLHMLDVELGWQWLAWQRVTFRLGLGAALTIGATTSIEPNQPPLYPQVSRHFTEQAADYLDHVYTSYVFTPTVSFAAGYRFF